MPVPRAISTSLELVMTTAQASGRESRARTRTDEPSVSAVGSKILSPPRSSAVPAIAGRRASSASPGHSVNPVSRWPVTAERSTGMPLA